MMALCYTSMHTITSGIKNVHCTVIKEKSLMDVDSNKKKTLPIFNNKQSWNFSSQMVLFLMLNLTVCYANYALLYCK